MADDVVVKNTDGLAFEDGEDRGRIIVPSAATNGAYSVMEWVVAPQREATATSEDFNPHQHGALEETFLVRSGELEFLIGDEVTVLRAGDFVRVPAGVRHGYRNVADADVDLVVTFVPGGFEQLFVKYRSDQESAEGPGFLEDATAMFDSSFE